MRTRTTAAAMLLCLSCSGDDNAADDAAGSSDGSTAAATGNDGRDDGQDDGQNDTTGPDSATTGSESGPDPDGTGSSEGTDGTTEERPMEPGPVVVYVTDGNSALQLWSVDDDTGALTMQASYDVGTGAAQLAVHPDGLHLYATGRGGDGNRVIAYEIAAADGTLTELGVTQLEIDPVYWSIHPSGNFGFSASFGGDEIASWEIAADYTVANGAVTVLDSGDEPHAIVPHPGGSWVYVPHRGTNEIIQYSVDAASGALAAVDTVAATPGAGARHLAFDAAGEHAYLANEFSDSVTHFTVDTTTGALTTMATLPTIPNGFDPGANTCADVHVTPDGHAVYVSNRGHDSLAMFSVDAMTGVLTPLGEIDTEPVPREFEVDPTGRFVYSAGQGSGDMAGYTIDEAGSLSAGATVTIGGSPAWVLAVELPR
ncbi:MAG: lactonase family protein [Nannocystaceae bacterium]|nr:lactonase family protein [Nannocystaceae bacterium]